MFCRSAVYVPVIPLMDTNRNAYSLTMMSLKLCTKMLDSSVQLISRNAGSSLLDINHD